MLTINIDTGGTFTDGYIRNGQRVYMAKVETTPHDLTVCFKNLIEEAAHRFDMDLKKFLASVDVIRYSTTVGTNALIQKTGPKIGLIVTKGAEELLYHQPGESLDRLRGWLDTTLITSVSEAINEHGEVLEPLAEDDVRRALRYLLDSGAESIVTVLHNSFYNPAHEQLIKKTVFAEYPTHFLGSLPVLVSSDIATTSAEHKRLALTVLNAYLHRDMVRYLYKAEEDLRRLPQWKAAPRNVVCAAK